MKPYISICISTYQRKNKLLRMIEELLKSQCNFEIVISDDGSTDGTAEAASLIQDSRIHFYQNPKNQGARQNWYCALMRGRGKYLFQLLDRDWIDHTKLDEFCELLQQTEPGYGYAGWSIMGENFDEHSKEKYTVYMKGQEGFQRFAGVPCHPSGFFIKTEIWNQIRGKRKFFYKDIYGIYPHAYLFTYAAQLENGIIVRNDLCDFNRCRREPLTKSGFYRKPNRRGYWWFPEQRYQQFLLSALCIKKSGVSYAIGRRTILQRFEEELESATLGYQYLCQDDVTQVHYGLKPHRVSNGGIIVWNILFSTLCIWYLKRNAAQYDIAIKDVMNISGNNAAKIWKDRKCI